MAVAVFALGQGSSAARGLWRGLPLSIARQDHTATPVSDGQVALVGGKSCRDRDQAGSTAELVDLKAMKTELLPALQVPRREHTTTVISGRRLVVVGGAIPPSHSGPIGATDSVEVLASRGGTWQRQDGPKMLHARRAHGAVALRDGRLMIIGGYGEHDEPLASVEIWDGRAPGWKEGPPLKQASANIRAHVLRDGRVFILSGDDHAEIWSPSAQSWRMLKPPGIREPSSRAITTVALRDGRILAVGSKRDDLSLRGAVSVWDPKSEAWSALGGVPPADDASAGFARPPWALAAPFGEEVVVIGPRLARAFSPRTRRWRSLEPQLLPLLRSALLPLPGGKLLLAGGHEGRCDLAEVWYPDDTPIGLWSPATVAMQPVAVLDSGEVLTISPVDPSAPGKPRQTAVWDPDTGKSGQSSTMSEPRTRFATIRLADGRILAAGGVDEGKATPDRLVKKARPDLPHPSMNRSTEIFSPDANRWSVAPPLNEARESFDLVAGLDGRVLALGGTFLVEACAPSSGGYHCRSQSGFRRTSEESWRPGDVAWQLTRRAAGPQDGASVSRLQNGTVLVVGGEPDGAMTMALDLRGNAWKSLAPLAHPRAHHAAAVLADDRVLVAGGAGARPDGSDDDARILATAEIWSPPKASWESAGSLNVGVFQGRALRLRDGRVMVTGMVSPRQQTATRPEIWNPTEGRWTPTPALTDDRACVPLLLKNGDVLMCGQRWSPR